jgi:hypothetical protein
MRLACAELPRDEHLGVAVREFPLKSGFADYLLHAEYKALGIADGAGTVPGDRGEAEEMTDRETPQLVEGVPA